MIRVKIVRISPSKLNQLRFISLVSCILQVGVRQCAADNTFYDPHDGTFALVARNPAGIQEPAVPLYYNGSQISGGNYTAVEIYDKVPGNSGFPLTVSDLIANTFVRPTYQLGNGTSGHQGTSVLATASYRTADGLQLIPTVTRSDVNTGGSNRFRNTVSGHFGVDANVTSVHTFPDDPLVGSTSIGITVHLEAQSDIELVTGAPFLASDRFRFLTVESAFASPSQFDANVIEYVDPRGVTNIIRLNELTPRDAHLFPSAVEIGSWFELIKEPGSTWYPDSPSLRVDVLGTAELRLGLQGFLAATTLPSDDSLTVWLEWLDAPNTIENGTALNLSAKATATPPRFAFLPGDYDHNDVVDAADYVVWRKNFGTQSSYDAWRTHFGQPAGSGAVASVNATVPEPATLLLLMLAAAGRCLRRGRAA